MPTSDPSVIAPVLREVMKLQPMSILDVGVGMGKWGLLFREYLEGWGKHRYCPERWQVRMDGVEIFPQYIQAWHKVIYNEIIIGDIRKVTFKTPYDLIYMGDVIEHMPMQDGWNLIRTMPYKTLIISTPNFKTRTIGRCKENVYQDHLSRWSAEEFRGVKHQILLKDRMLVVRVDK